MPSVFYGEEKYISGLVKLYLIMNLPFKKRHRVPASCSVCRKRKLKCDRVKPICGSCKLKSIAHLCFYESESKDGNGNSNGNGHAISIDANANASNISGLGILPDNTNPAVTITGLTTAVTGPTTTSTGPNPAPSPPNINNSNISNNNNDSIGNNIYVQQSYSMATSNSSHSQQSQSSLDIQNRPLDIHNHNLNNQLQNNHQHIPQITPHSSAMLQQVGQPPPMNPIPLPLPNPGFLSLGVQPSSNKPIPFSRDTSLFPFPTNKIDPASPPIKMSSQIDSPENFISPANSSITSNHSFRKSNDPSRNFDDGDDELVTIPLSGTTSLKLSPSDTLHVFTNASYSLNLEGPLWQQQGTFSYIGLTKSDPFIKIIRNYAILLFKSGEMQKFIKARPLKRKRQTPSSNSSVISDYTNSKRRKTDMGSPEFDEINESVIEDEEVVGDDALFVTQINKGRSPDDGDDDDEFENDAERDNVKQQKHSEDLCRKESIKTPSGISRSKSFPDIPHILPGLSLLFNGKKSRKDYYKIVEQAILSILPDKLNLFMLFCRYFKYVHPFVPIIDENSMLTDLEMIFDSFPSFSRGKYSEISIDNDNDLIILGNFLLIVRLGYISLIHNDNVSYNEDEQSMVNDMKKVSPETFSKVLHLCIGSCTIQSKSSFKIVQVLTLLHYYRMIDPNDCHGLGGADAQILLGVIVKHAMSIGLHRDPTFYVSHQSICKNKALIKIWRALWHYLVYLDASSSMHRGSCLDIGSLDMCDVELPTYDDKTGKLNDMVKSIGSICRSYRRIVQKINNVRNKPKVVDILKETNKLEKIFYSLFGKDYFKEQICKPAPTTISEPGSVEHEANSLKVLKFGIFLSLRTNLSCIYYMIAIHYENESTMKKTKSMSAGLELFKIYIKSVVQLVYIMSYVLEHSIELFGRNYDYILTASNERCMIKTHSFLTSFFVRLLHHKRYLSIKLESDPSIKPRLEVTDRLYELVLRESELFVGNFRRLSGKYVNSYKLYVMIYFVLRQCMINPDVFFAQTINQSSLLQFGTNSLQYFTISELDYLCKLCEEFKGAKSSQFKPSTALQTDDQQYKTDLQKFEPGKKSGKLNLNLDNKNLQDFDIRTPDIDLEEFTSNKLKAAQFNDDTPYGINSFTMNNSDTNFNANMLDNPNVDLVQLFEFFVDMEEKNPTK